MAVPTPISPLEPRRTAAPASAALQKQVKPWRGLHFVREVREIAPVLDVQVAAGMRPMPYALGRPVTAGSWMAETQPAQCSLLHAWREVRGWRHWISECDGRFEVASGQAGGGNQVAKALTVKTFRAKRLMLQLCEFRSYMSLVIH